MKVKLLLALLALGMLAICSLPFLKYLNGPYSPLFWATAPRQEIKVLVPKGYEGPVLIGYQVPDGETFYRQGDILIYHIHSDGALMLKENPPDGITSMTFWYVEPDGPLVPIPDSACFHDSADRGIVVCTGGLMGMNNAKSLRPNQSFYITKLADKSKRGAEYFALLDRYTERLALPK